MHSSLTELKGASSFLTQSIFHSKHVTQLVIWSCWGLLNPPVRVLTFETLKWGSLARPPTGSSGPNPTNGFNTHVVCNTWWDHVCIETMFHMPRRGHPLLCKLLRPMQKNILSFANLKLSYVTTNQINTCGSLSCWCVNKFSKWLPKGGNSKMTSASKFVFEFIWAHYMSTSLEKWTKHNILCMVTLKGWMLTWYHESGTIRLLIY